MGRRLEKRADDFIRGSEQPRGWQRTSSVGRLLADKDLLNEAKIKDEEPPHSNVLHVGNRFPKEPKPKNSGKGNDKKPIVPAKPKVEIIARQFLSPESDEEKLSRLEASIQSDEFSEAEKEFFDVMVKKYPHELQVAKEKIEKKGGIVDEKWAASVRTSYINERKRLGLEKNRWGSKIPLAPEKAELFEEYLKLKLPAGIPEERAENDGSKTENTSEANFTPEQSAKLVALIREVRKIQDQIDPKDFQEIIEVIIREDLIAQGIFSEEDFSRAFGHTVKWIEKFNKKK